jgi:sugar lactone lactonase YvrE
VVHNGDLYVGTISFTNPNGTILVYEKDGTLTQTFTIPALPQVGELLFADDHSLYAVAANIVNGQGSLVQLDTQTGNVTTIANGFSFPNGMVRDRFGNLFVTDLTAGTVTKVGSDGTISLFASSPLLTAAPIPGTGLSLGANDLTMDQKETALYVTNVGQNIVVKIAIQKNGSPGTITRFANIPTPDGITFDKQEGLLLVTSPFTNSIWTITRDGVSQQLSLNNALAQLNNPSNLIFQGHRLYITNLALGGTGSIVTVKLLPSDDD